MTDFYTFKWDGNALLSFKRPDDAALHGIRGMLGEMGVWPEQEGVQPAHRGDLNSIMESLQDDLMRDAQNTEREREEWAGDFDYVVVHLPERPHQIAVLTRLFHSEKSGNIFYGRRIQRITDAEYVLWMD